MRQSRSWLALIALTLAMPPAPAAAQRAGTLISARAATDAPAGMRAWRIQYWTNSDRSRPIRVTGMVIAPEGRPAAAARRVIAWAHGTSGVARKCAPSEGDANYSSIPDLADAVRRGYVVVAPDYPGLGSAGVHPYLVGTSAARSVLDAVRAARRIAGADAGTGFAVWGESQGGHAALWTGQIWRTYAPDLQLKGIAAIVPPTDLARNLTEAGDARARALLTAFTAASWSRYFGAPMSTFGSRSNQNVMLRLADNNCLSLRTRPRLGMILGINVVQRAIRNLNLGRIQPWGRLMRENSPSPTAVPVPLLIASGTADVIVAPAVTRDFVRRACAAGKTVRYRLVRDGGHATVARTEARATLDWIDARFNGQPAPDDCQSI